MDLNAKDGKEFAEFIDRKTQRLKISESLRENFISSVQKMQSKLNKHMEEANHE